MRPTSRRWLRVRVRVLPVLLTALEVAGAQSHEVRGVVVASDGERVSGAEVFVVPGAAWAFARGPVVAIRAVTDAEGRFRAKVDPERGYSLWARFGASGGRITAVLEAADLGRRLRLVETRAPLATRLRIDGLAAWKALGAHDCFAIDGLDVWHRLDVDDEGECSVPAVPGDSVTIAVVDRERRVLVTTAVWLFEHMRRTMRRNLIQVGRAKDGEQLELTRVVRRLRPPIRVPIRIQSDAGLAAARIVVDSGSAKVVPFVRPVLRDGVYEVVVPETAVPLHQQHAYAFRVDAPGFATERVGWDYGWNRPASLPKLFSRDVKDGRTPEIRVALKQGATRAGRVVDAGRPVAEREIVGLVERDKGDPKRAWAYVVRTATARDGTFSFSGLAATDELTRIVIAPADGSGSGVELLVPEGAAPWTIDLAKDVRTIAVVIKRADGEPARGARLEVLRDARPAASTRLWPAIESVADLRGRCRVQVGAKQDKLAIVSDTQFAFVTLAAADEQEVELASMPSIRGRVVDVDEKPIAGAELWMRGASGGGVATAFGRYADRHNHARAKTRCDDRGRFEFRILPGNSDFEVAAQVWVGANRHVSQNGLHVYHDAIDDAELRIPVRR